MTPYDRAGTPGTACSGSIPLLRRGGRPEGADGVVGHLLAHAKKTTPALRATPPKEGNFAKKGRREAPKISFPSLGGVAGPKGLTGWSVTFPHTPRKPPRRLRRHPS